MPEHQAMCRPELRLLTIFTSWWQTARLLDHTRRFDLAVCTYQNRGLNRRIVCRINPASCFTLLSMCEYSGLQEQNSATEGGVRTLGHKVKSLALYQLSYPGKDGM